MADFEYLLSTIDRIKGVGKKTLSSFNKKKIFTIFDLLWHLPISKIETAEDTEIEDLQIGKNYNIKVKPIKYNFPRIRNLPNRVVCEKNGIKIDCIFFNSYEGYIRKILPLNENVIINGKATIFKNKFQFVNPTLKNLNNTNIIKDDSKYSLSEGLTLTEANHVLFVNRWWNPSSNQQARDRVVRIGQERIVEVRNFVISGTVEERVSELLEAKELTFDELIVALENDLKNLS